MWERRHVESFGVILKLLRITLGATVSVNQIGGSVGGWVRGSLGLTGLRKADGR